MQIDYTEILSAVSIISIVFAVFLFFYKPQVKSDKDDAILSLKVDALTKDLTNLRDNHLHTLDVKVDQLTDSMGKMGNEVTKLATIIEERIPRIK